MTMDRNKRGKRRTCITIESGSTRFNLPWSGFIVATLVGVLVGMHLQYSLSFGGAVTIIGVKPGDDSSYYYISSRHHDIHQHPHLIINHIH